jgi:hypothetical protein
MAHFAEVNNEGIVQRVIVVDNLDTLDENGEESEAVGASFCHNLLGGTWKQTSYNANIRKNYAGVGYFYNEELDAFSPPKPFSKWVLDEETAQWEAPTPMPESVEDERYVWNDNKGEWEVVS